MKGFPGKDVTDSEGDTFGPWLVIKRAGSDGECATWHCKCVNCGAEKIKSRQVLLETRKRASTRCVDCHRTVVAREKHQ